jgi:hypothetical protein
LPNSSRSFRAACSREPPSTSILSNIQPEWNTEAIYCERIRTQLSSSQCDASDLAPVGLLASVAAWLAGATFGCLAGGLLLGAVIPFTRIVILPTNKQLLHPALDKHSGQTGPLLARWADCMPCEASSVLSRCCSCTWRSSGEPFNRGSSHSGFNPADASFKVATR